MTLSGDAVVEHAPELLPDVFSAPSDRGEARGRRRLALVGDARPWDANRVPPTGPARATGLVALFARECVADLETRLSLGKNTRGFDREIESLGTTFQISTRLTSWVAVDTVVSTEPGGRSRKESVPQEVPYGTNVESFGLRAAGEAPRGARAAAASADRTSPRRLRPRRAADPSAPPPAMPMSARPEGGPRARAVLAAPAPQRSGAPKRDSGLSRLLLCLLVCSTFLPV